MLRSSVPHRRCEPHEPHEFRSSAAVIDLREDAREAWRRTRRWPVTCDSAGSATARRSSQPCAYADISRIYVYLRYVGLYEGGRYHQIRSRIFIEKENQFLHGESARAPGCELRPAAIEPAAFAGHRPLGVLRRASEAGVLYQRAFAHASRHLLTIAVRVRHINRTSSALFPRLLITHEDRLPCGNVRVACYASRHG